MQTIALENLLTYDHLQLLKTEYDQLHEDFLGNLRSIDEMALDLVRDNDQWTTFNDELKRLETLLSESASVLERNALEDKPLEDRQQILQVRKSRLAVHATMLSFSLVACLC